MYGRLPIHVEPIPCVKKNSSPEMENNGTKILMERYEVGRLLGQGQFAKVHYARDLQTGNSVAIKVIDKEKAQKAGLTTTNIKQEIHIMRLVHQHKNVLNLYEVLASKTKIYFVLEYAKGGELFQKVAKGRLKEDTTRKYIHQLINAVDFCHKRGVYHRDLKPENLLLDGDGMLKVSDFGLARNSRDSMMLRTMCGTPAYVAPEVVSRRGYDGSKSDVWSCGVILYVMLAGYLPFHDENIIALYRKASNGDYKFPTWFSPEVCRLVLRMLDPNAATRISISEIINDPWFRKGLDDHDHENDITNSVTTSTAEEQEGDRILKPTNLNAFDIISFSTGLDLSGMFAQDDLKSMNDKQTLKFVSMKSGSEIVSKLEGIAASRRLRIKNRDRGMLVLEEAMDVEGGVIRGLCVDAEVFEFTPFCHLVELRMSGEGDSVEQWRIAERSWLREDLKDIVWSWMDGS